MKAELLEGISDVVYHFTPLHNAYKILDDNRFRLSPSYANDAEESLSSKLYYLSTTRSRLGHYHNSDIMGVLFKLDGRKLRSQNKGSPIHYWNTVDNAHEFEDRVFSDKPTMESIRYIDVIEVLYTEDSDVDHTGKLALFVKFIYMFSKKNGIPCKVYKSSNGLKTRNRKLLYNHEELMNMGKGISIDRSPTFSDKRDYTKLQKPERELLYQFLQVYYNDYDTLDSDGKSMYGDIMHSPDIVRILQGEIKSNSNKNTKTKVGNYVERIGEIMRKEKVSTVSGLVDKLRLRFKKP